MLKFYFPEVCIASTKSFGEQVFARFRPFLPNDGKQGNKSSSTLPFSLDGGRIVTVANPNDISQPYKFTFDRVFPPSAGQDAVFEEVSELVRSAVNGYKVCLFSYGQVLFLKPYFCAIIFCVNYSHCCFDISL